MDINFLHKEKSEPEDRGPSVRGFLLLLSLTIATLLVFGTILFIQRTGGSASVPIVTRIQRLFLSADAPLQGERDDRINVLLLGMGGEGHEGAYLTDTIILASFQPSTKSVALMSIPRDLSVLIPQTRLWGKINAVNAYAESADPGNGGEGARQLAEQLLQIPIPYYIRMDFQGFVQLIDDVGGVTVNVDNRLDDEFYPITGNEDVYPIEARYEHLVIESGEQAMDGARALKFVRSRRAKGVEGSDFARVKRQQAILLAFKEKTFSWPTLTSPSRISRIVSDLTTHIATNITFREGVRFAQLLKNINRTNTRRVALSDAPEGLLTARIVNGAYILEPSDGTFDAIRALVQNIFTKPAPTLTLPPQQKTPVTILNGTTIPGLAKTVADILTAQGFSITRIDNAPLRSLQRTVVYDLTQGKNYLAYDRLRLLLNAVPANDPGNPLATQPPTDRDDAFLIILGADAKPL
ncbi:LCP family protein [Candidatus Uhrbacteria bacterium]|nr:LCP family protein [Candidatus Uhrbacteria bacterium]